MFRFIFIFSPLFLPQWRQREKGVYQVSVVSGLGLLEWVGLFARGFPGSGFHVVSSSPLLFYSLLSVAVCPTISLPLSLSPFLPLWKLLAIFPALVSRVHLACWLWRQVASGRIRCSVRFERRARAKRDSGLVGGRLSICLSGGSKRGGRSRFVRGFMIMTWLNEITHTYIFVERR